MDLPAYYEPVIDNEYLQDFYRETKRYSFQLQVYLLNKRFSQHQQIIWQGRGGVQDRSIYEDGIFAKMLADAGLMDERDYRCYCSLFQNMSNFMRKPNLIVHLDVKPAESLARIKERSRDCETGITIEYLQALYDGYEQFLKDISRVIPVIRVNWNTFRTAEEMALVVKEKWLQMSNIHCVDWTEKPPATSPLASPLRRPVSPAGTT